MPSAAPAVVSPSTARPLRILAQRAIDRPCPADVVDGAPGGYGEWVTQARATLYEHFPRAEARRLEQRRQAWLTDEVLQRLGVEPFRP